MKFSVAVEGFFLDRGLQLAKTTVANYRHYFGLFQTFMNDQDIETITGRDITRFLLHLSQERGLSDRTVHDVRARLSSLWTWANGELGIDNIVARVPKPTYRNREIVPYTRQELHQLLDAATHDRQWRARNGQLVQSKRATALRDRAILLTLVDTGIRASELCDLTIGDYDQRRGRLHIRHGKGDKGRFVITGKRTQKALWRYLATRAGTQPSDPLFASGAGNRLDRHNLYNMVVRTGERANVAGAGIHRFRHTFAINFLKNGGNVFELQALLGHEDIKTVAIYVRLSELDLDATQRHSPADNWRL